MGKRSKGELFNLYDVVKQLYQVINVGLNMVSFRARPSCNKLVADVMGTTAGRDNDVFETREIANAQLFRGPSV